ncbi:hypothetical protein [Bosea sp. RAC05]|uniref:hypothetical protein n=1 Tax=Bosea sp. RAC05 TaxID=1842539 RepID=UPI0008563544|nr:hypothetical protein [Bosea sp. RAC05]AOG02968.1 hypothetical protein BSY19_5300 [Bosea sp. RAC05]
MAQAKRFIDMAAIAVAWEDPAGRRHVRCAAAGTETGVLIEIIREGYAKGDIPVVEMRPTTVRVPIGCVGSFEIAA